MGSPSAIRSWRFIYQARADQDAIDPETGHIRTAEYQLFRGTDFESWLSKQELAVIGMREMRDVLRATLNYNRPTATTAERCYGSLKEETERQIQLRNPIKWSHSWGPPHVPAEYLAH